MTQSFARIIAMTMLGAIVAAGVGAMCLMPAMAQHSSMAACHSTPKPSPPKHSEYRCCVNRDASALVTSLFSLRPAVGRFEADTIQLLVAGDRVASSITQDHSSSPPPVLILRI